MNRKDDGARLCTTDVDAPFTCYVGEAPTFYCSVEGFVPASAGLTHTIDTLHEPP